MMMMMTMMLMAACTTHRAAALPPPATDATASLKPHQRGLPSGIISGCSSSLPSSDATAPATSRRQPVGGRIGHQPQSLALALASNKYFSVLQLHFTQLKPCKMPIAHRKFPSLRSHSLCLSQTSMFCHHSNESPSVYMH